MDGKFISFVAGVASTAFGAGLTFAVWNASHPTEVRVAEMLADTKIDAKEARAGAMRIEGDIRGLRKDLARGFGRAYAVKPSARDDAGKRAIRQYELEISRGVPHDEALRHAIEESLVLPYPEE